MNVDIVVRELRRKYPGKKIIKNNSINPTEILCEVEPTAGHTERSKAIAVIDASLTHYHKIATEIYTVLRGALTIFLNGKPKVVSQGQSCEIKPYTIHWAEGDAVWVEIYSSPGWTMQDHILVGKEAQIHIVPYNPIWSDMFEKEKVLIEKTLGAGVVGGVHHVGSTSVFQLAAKPIIDIMVGVKNLKEVVLYIPLLEAIGYQYFPYRSDIMHWFCKPSLEHRTHHVYLMESTGDAWNERLAFRDYLRSQEEAKYAYEQLKRKLADMHKDDREAYTEAKSKYISMIVHKALCQR